jgi:hypothetical protein
MVVAHHVYRGPGIRLTWSNGVLADRPLILDGRVGDVARHPAVNAIAVEENGVLDLLLSHGLDLGSRHGYGCVVAYSSKSELLQFLSIGNIRHKKYTRLGTIFMNDFFFILAAR